MPIDAKRSIRILVVEDDAVTARGMQRSLNRMGYGVLEIASSANRAIELALEHKPDLILMAQQHTDHIRHGGREH
jgi:CheY-like chemotaxis protein